MSFRIANPPEDMRGNSRKNIFVAEDEDGKYLGHSYAWSYENHHTSHTRPRNILIMVESALPPGRGWETVWQTLFNRTLERAYRIRNERWPGETVRIYGGATADQQAQVDMYLKQGFEDDDATIVMEKTLRGARIPPDSETVCIRTSTLESEPDRTAFMKRHGDIFPTELNIDALGDFMDRPGWMLFQIIDDGSIIGECMVFDNDGAGYIELFYVVEEARGRGVADALLNHVEGWFLNRGHEKARLVVWQRNARAVKFYQKHGYEYTGEREEIYPGIDV